MVKRLLLVHVLVFATLTISACQPLAPVSTGTPLPAIKAVGWVNSPPPAKLNGKVVVLVAFATW